ncbi:protein phosphatase 1 regulatory subunit 36 isoform X2 [Nannospalax galili]|uniref:protein phosphatase 1 regulatory subunit 36 isoform X2 n=1 Tax=Nannospalax galili TaxID=1026970 RepID=UPI00111C1B89|nr:protein phosphatase 1 regulatory subunit 36 isoform X2 [Nannospalax galili]
MCRQLFLSLPLHYHSNQPRSNLHFNSIVVLPTALWKQVFAVRLYLVTPIKTSQSHGFDAGTQYELSPGQRRVERVRLTEQEREAVGWGAARGAGRPYPWRPSAARSEALHFVPEFYARRKQFNRQSTQVNLSPARVALTLGVGAGGPSCPRPALGAAGGRGRRGRSSAARPGRRSRSWSIAPPSALPCRRLRPVPTVLQNCWAHLPPNPGTESFTPAVELKEKGKKGKAVHFTEIDGPASERLTDKRLASRDEKSAKALEKQCQQGTVTLDDVKFVALLSLQDTEMQRVCSFTTFMRNKNLDNLLMALLYYLSYYLEKNSLEKKPKSYMVEKISDTQKDWKFFESFYTFCTRVAWIVFRRQHLTEIEEEVGRLFHTNMFNIPRRKREDEESGGVKKRMTLVQFRRMMAKRPAIKKAVDMRSPVLSTLLPSLREKAQHIAEKKYVAGIKLPPHMENHIASLESVAMPIVGILGEPRYLFNPHTLLPLELEENGKLRGRNSSIMERNNMRIQDTLDLVVRTLFSQN